MSMPRMSRTASVMLPEAPMVAMNANASGTPPNWASTPLTAVTTRRNALVAGRVTMRYARNAPNTAPTTALVAESSTLRHITVSVAGSNRPWMLSRVKPPSPWKAPTITVTVGTTRKIARYARKGSSPAQGAIRDRRAATAQPTALAQFADRYFVAFSVCATVGVTALPLTVGRALYAALSIEPAWTIESARTGRAPPPSQRFWPSSE